MALPTKVFAVNNPHIVIVHAEYEYVLMYNTTCSSLAVRLCTYHDVGL